MSMSDSEEEKITGLQWIREQVLRYEKNEFPVRTMLKVTIKPTAHLDSEEVKAAREDIKQTAAAYRLTLRALQHAIDTHALLSVAADKARQDNKCARDAYNQAELRLQTLQKRSQEATHKEIALLLHTRLQSAAVMFECEKFDDMPPPYYISRSGYTDREHVRLVTSFFKDFNAQLALRENAPQVEYNMILVHDTLEK